MKEAVFVAFVVFMVIFLVLAALAMKNEEECDSTEGSSEPSALVSI